MWTNGPVLSIFPAADDAYFFDRSGRFFAAWEAGWFIGFGLSGRAIARRWQAGRRQVRALKPAEVQTAQALGVSTSTVKSQTRVALQRLRDLAPDVVSSFHDVPEEVAE